ncbi:MAG: SDR family oxidoreductase [Actinomycetota bacterium]|nr:SDR family oxidoreductase [Actinomycetota bacterium]MDD5668194.1 SDR family oxidoreductase [Actinomycetota bacterium]
MAEVRFDDRVAVVTGAGGGLGREYALLLASRGAKVVINDLGGAFDGTGSGHTAAEQVCQEIKDAGGEAVPNFDSVADWEGASNIIKTAIDTWGKIDILINNAGILRDKSFIKMEMEDYEKVLAVHLNGTFFCSKAAFPHMRENNYGRIISASSGAGVYGNFGQANYAAAKMGIVGLMHVLKQEGAKYNIMANAIVPVAGTRMTATVFPADLLDVLKPQFVAPVVAWACSENCTVSGYTFTAGGGYFSRTAFMEGPGVYFDVKQPITLEMIDENIDKITSLEGAVAIGSATEHAGLILGKMSQG